MSRKNWWKSIILLSGRGKKKVLAFLLVILGIVVIAVPLVVFLYILPSQGNDSNGPNNQLVVSTTYGDVEGFYLNYTTWNENITSVKAWRGIPFASPPIGNLRWMPPIAAESWDGVLSCKEFKTECIQAWGGSGSEDCLYLNVYASVEADDEGPWPVYVDIYGGGLMGGSATANFNGLINADVAEQEGKGLVVVAPAYRLNLFGFLATSELSEEQNGASGNYGIQDQQFALKWIQENIRNFNGDPNNVVIGGWSSGGTSSFALLSSPLSAGLFHAAMSYSGSTNLTMDLLTAQNQNVGIVNSSGCSQAGYTFEQINSCMRALNSSIIYSLIPESWNTPGIWGLPAGPHGQNYAGLVIVDGRVITKSFANALADGLIDVPFLFGHMGFEPDEFPDDYVWDYNASQWHGMLNQTFQSWNNGDVIANEMYNLYLNDSMTNPQRAYDRIVADYGLFCSQIILAKNALLPMGNYQSNIYIYYHEWSLSKPFIGGSGNPVHYAMHSIFYIQLTDQWNWLGNGTYIPTSEDLDAQYTVQNNIWSFFVNHYPTSTWNKVNSASDWPSSYVIFDINTPAAVSKVNYRENVCDTYQSIGLIRPNYWWCN